MSGVQIPSVTPNARPQHLDAGAGLLFTFLPVRRCSDVVRNGDGRARTEAGEIRSPTIVVHDGDFGA